MAEVRIHHCDDSHPLDAVYARADKINELRESIKKDKEPTGLKFDAEKPRMDLLDSEFLEGVAKVLTFGAKKYAAHNWRGGINVSRLVGAAFRHLASFNRGQDLDEETGLSHLYHAACCLMFAAWMVNHKPELDDRWKEETTKPTKEDDKFGWKVNVNLINELTKNVEYPAHPIAVEQILLKLREKGLLNESN